jgi:hypothetical protein
MPDLEEERVQHISDFSRGMQEKTSRFLRRDNELRYAQNARFTEIGGISPAFGFEQSGSDLTSSTSTSSSTSTTTTSTSSSTSTSTTTSTSTST